MISKAQAILAIDPSLHIAWHNDEITVISGTLPTEAEIQAKLLELQADYDAKQYQRNRAAAYPSWQDQLDRIFHSGVNAWKADIQKIKDQFPKP